MQGTNMVLWPPNKTCSLAWKSIAITGMRMNAVGGTLGKVHVLTEQEMEEAFSFWEKRMSELGRTAFINPADNRWVCPVNGG